MRVPYYLYVIPATALLLWWLLGRWDSETIYELKGADVPTAEVVLGADGKGQLTHSALGQLDTVNVSFKHREGVGSLPDYELRILSDGRLLRANMLFHLVADPRGPRTLICTDCVKLNANLPLLWEIAAK